MGRKSIKKLKISSDLCEMFQMYKLESTICIVGAIVTCAMFKYIDGISLQAWALETGDAFLRGGLSGYSEILSQNLWKAPHGVLSLRGSLSIHNILYAAWNLPLLLIHYFFKTGYSISFCERMWGKLYLVLFVVAIGYIAYKIVVKITDDTNKGVLAAITIFSAPTIMVAAVGYAMQDEVVYEFFIVMGLYEAICGRKNRSLVWLVLACLNCPLIVLFCIPIVLYSSKKVGETIWRLTAILGATVLEIRWLYFGSSGSANGEIGNVFTRIGFYVTYSGKFSLVAMIFMLIYLMQWSFKQDDDKTYQAKRIVWNVAIISTTYCTFSAMSFYRFMLCVPFLIISLMIVQSYQAVKSGLLGLLFFEIIRIYAMYGRGFLRLYAFPRALINLFGLNEGGGSETVLSVLNLIFPQLTSNFSAFSGIGVACSVWVLYVSYPKRKNEIVCPISSKVLTVAWCSTQIIIAVAVSLFLLKISIFNVTIGTTNATIAIDGQNYVEEYYRGKSASKLFITINPSSTGKDYPKGQTLNLDVIDADSGEVIAATSYDASQIKSGTEITFRIENIKMQSGKWYKFRFYSPVQIENEDHYMYLHTGIGTANPDRHYAVAVENGAASIGDYDIVRRVITF